MTLNRQTVAGLQIVSQAPGTKTLVSCRTVVLFSPGGHWTEETREAMTPVIRLDRQICSLVC